MDVEDLAEKMERILHLSDFERKEMGKKGHQKMIKEFDINLIINIYNKKISL